MLGLYFTGSLRHSPPPPRDPRKMSSYLKATRHPLPCLLFLLPLLLVYEVSVLYLGGTDPDALRNGADSWLHGGLGAFGLQQLYWAPALLVAALAGWCWTRREDRPDDLVGVCTGMAIESVFAAIALWMLSRGLRPLLDRFGVVLDCTPPVDEMTANLVSYLGAGIYEEVLFRLVLFGSLCWLLRQLFLPTAAVLPLATAAAAIAFAAAHHLGPCGERFDAYVFVFRSLAGFYFTLVYLFRGFGVAVGAHACYDIFVGLAMG